MIDILHDYSLADVRARSMFEDRRALFVDLLGWDVPVIDDRYEIDSYDGEGATYLIAADDDGQHVGSMRLLRTDRAHLLSDRFPMLCEGELPSGSDVLEITRLCLTQRLGATGRLWVRNRLISAMVDHALRRGIRILTGVVTGSYRKQVLAMGWRALPLGPALAVGGARLGAFRVEIDGETPALLAAKGIYSPGMIAAGAHTAACLHSGSDA